MSIGYEILHKEIDLIQSSINRMAQNSFMCKGWMFSLIVAILAWLPEDISKHNMCLLIICINIYFWVLDAFYLWQEKLFRSKYEWVIHERLEGNNNYLYDMNPNNQNMLIECAPSYFSVLISKTLLIIYGSCIGGVLYLLITKYQ